MKKLLRIFLCVMAVILCTTASLAHGGRTDINGGHTDKNNTSGLGRYHYHCGGNPAHLHEDGICPYHGDKPGYYFNGEWHEVDLPDFDIDAPDYAEEYTGEIKLKEETKTVTKEKTGVSKFLDVLSTIFSVIYFVIAFLATVVSPIFGLIYFICIGIKKTIKKIKTKKDQR